MILIVDDSPGNIFTLKTLLELNDFPTDTARGGEEALRKVLKNSYALIILDVQMPGMDGFELAEILSGNNATKDIPIIFLSAINIEKKYITKGYSSGGIDYVTKPIDPDILLLRVKTLYRLYEQNRALNEMQNILKKEIEFRESAQQEAQVASRLKEEFISIASHELKTPLASMKAYVQLLERSLDKNDKVKIYVDRTLVQINKLNSLIADILDSSRIENGMLKFNKSLFNFGKLLKETVEMICQTYPDYSIKVSGDSNVLVFGDELRLEQVIINFMTNAIKYSPDIKKLEIHSTTENGFLIVAVRDFGIGIPKENHAEVFSKFYRVEGAAQRFPGLGIGLYICCEIIHRHNGKCWLESEPGKGSTFFFSLPTAIHMNENQKNISL
ncbi:MAG TPA: hybrid sensor histidine kinase/response regulator [Puia sp.]|jgi:two-component system sensor histidine kinase/response regulator|nr:hybrid sensor histidine kinase/response regulator [Puia sp.]